MKYIAQNEVIHPTQGVLKVMNHSISVTALWHLEKMPPPEKINEQLQVTWHAYKGVGVSTNRENQKQ
jgi:hypothetical protein